VRAAEVIEEGRAADPLDRGNERPLDVREPEVRLDPSLVRRHVKVPSAKIARSIARAASTCSGPASRGSFEHAATSPWSAFHAVPSASWAARTFGRGGSPSLRWAQDSRLARALRRFEAGPTKKSGVPSRSSAEARDWPSADASRASRRGRDVGLRVSLHATTIAGNCDKTGLASTSRGYGENSLRGGMMLALGPGRRSPRSARP
jgi:hypothetical protein